MSTQTNIAQYIDHTLLKSDATDTDLQRLCEEAVLHKFYSVCVNSGAVAFCVKHLSGSNVKVVSVVGFPLGACLTEAKFAETRAACTAGAQEIDVVLSIGALKSHRLDDVEEDLRSVVIAAGERPVKVILETHLLTDEEKILACQVSERAGALFVKTSSGFTGGGATVEDVELMRKTVSKHIQVKASGGIKTREQAEAMIKAGATRLGTSSGVAIVLGQSGTSSY